MIRRPAGRRALPDHLDGLRAPQARAALPSVDPELRTGERASCGSRARAEVGLEERLRAHDERVELLVVEIADERARVDAFQWLRLWAARCTVSGGTGRCCA
jgi:hypothetical protein